MSKQLDKEINKYVVYYCDARLVTPYSMLEFRLCCRKSIRSNLVLGRTSIDLHALLKQHNGKCEYYYCYCCCYYYCYYYYHSSHSIAVDCCIIITVHRVTTCLENLEMSGNLKHVREMSGIMLTVGEMSGKKSCQGKVS